jgi:serine/threonine-protein kinase
VSLAAGTTIGPYSVVAPIGAGGMGQVYRARDTRLDRDVAIKVLPDLFAADPERLARFEREAKTLASLNHPHIAQIYGIEPLGDSGARALVMEMVDGEDLTARVARGPVPLADALPIAQQIAEALEAAHERGIIHRDLKPANIKVTDDGAVKVLDFGLAKALTPDDDSATAHELRNSPTMSIAGTQIGMVLGTAAYMAPEQARGQTVDRRVDIWAFGVVLFEMLSGRQAFSGDTVSDVLASVLKNDLDWQALPPALPAPILRLLRRCLHPDRRNRLRDIGEARVALAEFLAGTDEASVREAAPAAGGPSTLQFRIVAVAAAALAIVAAGLAWRGGPVEPRPMRYVVAPPAGASALVVGRPSVALSPDGSTLAFVALENGVPFLYLRGPEDFEPLRLPGTEGASNPVFSPGGRTIAFLTTSQLKTMIVGGAVTVHGPANDPRGVSWVDETTLVYTPESIGGIQEVSLKGGAPRTLTTIDEKAGERTHRWPHVLPDGRWVLFTVGTIASPDSYEDARIDAVNRDTGERRTVFQGASMARYAPTGHLIVARGGSLFAVKFEAGSLQISGVPTSVLQGIGGDMTTGAAHVTWSPDGTFAYVPGDLRGGMRQLEWSDLTGSRQSINLPPSLYNDIRISPDGNRLALADGSSGMADIYTYTFDRGTYTRLTFTGVNATPAWSEDGREVFFSAIDATGRGTTIFRTSADGGRDAAPLVEVDVRVFLKHVSADASWALVDYVAFGGARANVGRLALKAGAKVEPLVETRVDEYGAALSPDGRFIAYQSDEGARPEVFVRELSQASGRWQISNGGGEEPMWAPDGRALYYRIEDRLMAVPIEPGATFQPGLPRLMFDGIFNLRSDTGVSYQPHPDRKRLLLTRPAEVMSRGTVRVMTRWFDELRAIK